MIAIVFATAREAAPFMQRHYCKPEIKPGPVELYACRTAGGRKALVCLCGMGKVAAALAAQWLFLSFRCAAVINAGACGALKSGSRWRPGDVFQIRQAVEGDHRLPERSPEVHVCSPLPRSDLPATDLVTVDSPLFDDLQRERLAALGSLVDMEGAAVARAAGIYGRPVYLLKGITDFASGGQRAMLYENIDAVSVRLAEVVTRVVDYQL